MPSPSIIDTVVGGGSQSHSDDLSNGTPVPALDISIYPKAVAVGNDGSLYFSQGGNEAGTQYPSNRQMICKVDPGGMVTRVAGNGTYGFSGDGGPALSAQLHGPSGIERCR